MYTHAKREHIDPKAPYLPMHYGTFEQYVMVGGKKRRFLAYVPDGTRESTAGVLVFGENGKRADDLWADSGWRTVADQEECKEKMIAFFLEPENGTWHTDEPYGCLDGDVAYVEAVYAAVSQRYLYCVHESKVYLSGCRAGGTLASMAALWNPAVYAGIAVVDGDGVSPDYIAAASNDFCTNLHGQIDEQHRKGIRKGQIPLPAWIIRDTQNTAKALEHHWRQACGTADTPRRISPDTLEYYRIDEAPYAPNQEKEAFRVWVSEIKDAAENDAQRLQRRIWKDFLYRQRRWMSGPGGDLRVTRDPVRDLGMEYHDEEIDGWMREWYVYVPKRVHAQSGTRVPLVLAMHGYTCSGEIYAGNSEWHKVAEDNGFIVVYPTALYARIEMENNAIDPNNIPLPAWNVFAEADRPDELHFFKTMLDRVCKTHPIDESRIYATGHSWGSLMTQMLALAMPERFAAVAPCSGVFFGGAEKRMLALPALQAKSAIELPVWMMVGEEEPWLMPAQPKDDNETGFTIAMWLNKNGMEKPKDWARYPIDVHGRWRDRTFMRDGTPFVRYTAVEYMPHATMTEMSYRIWDEFFSRMVRSGSAVVYSRKGLHR